MSSHNRFLRAAAALVLLSTLPVPTAVAQALGRIEQTETNVSSYYHFAERGTATVKVLVLGSVASPGIYEVSDGTDLETLLVLAKPVINPPAGSGIGRSRMLVQLFREQTEGRELLYEAELSDTFERRSDRPVLREGDFLMVEMRENRLEWRDLLRIAQTIAVFGLAIDRLSRAF